MHAQRSPNVKMPCEGGPLQPSHGKLQCGRKRRPKHRATKQMEGTHSRVSSCQNRGTKDKRKGTKRKIAGECNDLLAPKHHKLHEGHPMTHTPSTPWCEFTGAANPSAHPQATKTPPNLLEHGPNLHILCLVSGARPSASCSRLDMAITNPPFPRKRAARRCLHCKTLQPS